MTQYTLNYNVQVLKKTMISDQVYLLFVSLQIKIQNTESVRMSGQLERALFKFVYFYLQLDYLGPRKDEQHISEFKLLHYCIALSKFEFLRMDFNVYQVCTTLYCIPYDPAYKTHKVIPG